MNMRKTYTTVQTAMAIMERPNIQHWGVNLSKRTGIRSGVIYPILKRMVSEGWLSVDWEDPNVMKSHSTPRRYYVLTENGHTALTNMLEEARADQRFSALALT